MQQQKSPVQQTHIHNHIQISNDVTPLSYHLHKPILPNILAAPPDHVIQLKFYICSFTSLNEQSIKSNHFYVSASPISPTRFPTKQHTAGVSRQAKPIPRSIHKTADLPPSNGPSSCSHLLASLNTYRFSSPPWTPQIPSQHFWVSSQLRWSRV